MNGKQIFAVVYILFLLFVISVNIYCFWLKPNPAPVVVAEAKVPTCLVQLRRENTMYEWRGVIK